MNFTWFTKKRIYLDWASGAPVHPRALKAFFRAQKSFGNPSSPHDEGRKAKDALGAARTSIARLAGVKSSAVVFTSGATEANALAVQGRIQRCLARGMKYEDMHVLYLQTMHSSVVKTIEMLAEKGVQVEPVPLAKMAIDIEATKKLLRPSTILVCLDAVCGETGTRFETLQVRRAIDALTYNNALLHVDASQLPLVEPIERTRLGADMLILDAQKVGGVRGIGALLVPNKDHLLPLVVGGGQEGGLRPGTEPVALAAAFAEALAVCSENHVAFAKHAEMERAMMIAALPAAQVIEAKRHAPHILNLSFPGIDTDYLVMLLDAKGFAVSTKSACETDSADGSKVVYLLTGDKERAQATLRISWGPKTDKGDMKNFIQALISSVHFLEANTI